MPNRSSTINRLVIKATDPKGKLHPNWEDIPSIKKVIQNEAVKARDTGGNAFTNPVDIDKLKALLKSTR